MTKIYTTGVFDIMHRGHFNVLTKAAGLGDYLVVGILDSEECAKVKGQPTILSTEERIEQLKSLPFVNEVVVYKDLDQRSMYELIKPDIIVQGDDWIHTADRTEVLTYIREHNIRLILLPRTSGVSTTEMRKRIFESNRRDLDILDSVKLLKIEDLSFYEEYDEEKVKKLVEKIKTEGVFFNPITVGKVDELLIVIDGANRFEALKRIGAKYITALVLPYRSVDLQANVHFKKDGKITRLSEFAGEGERIEFPKRTHDDIIAAVREGRTIPSGETWHRPSKFVIRMRVSLQDLITGFDFDQYLKDLVENGDIRYYPANVYVCDEWYNQK